MSNIAFIVDGFTEKLIIERICPKRPVRRTDLNGRDVSINAMIEKIATLIRIFNNRYYPVIIVVDKEERSIDFKSMCKMIEEGLVNVGIPKELFVVGVADRMLENWIVADWNSLCLGAENQLDRPESTDGIHGVSMIKKIRGSYDKTGDGVELFMSSSFSEMYFSSPSFRDLIDKLDGKIECWYMNQ